MKNPYFDDYVKRACESDKLKEDDPTDNAEHSESIIQFFLPIRIPTVTAQERRVIPGKVGKNGKVSRPLFIDTPELANARGKYLAHLSQHKPEKKLDGPLALRIVWCFKATKNHYHGAWKASKPDTDNLIKLFKDCMTKVGFWIDDAQVAWELQEKRYSDIEGIFVQINQLLTPMEQLAKTGEFENG